MFQSNISLCHTHAHTVHTVLSFTLFFRLLLLLCLFTSQREREREHQMQRKEINTLYSGSTGKRGKRVKVPDRCFLIYIMFSLSFPFRVFSPSSHASLLSSHLREEKKCNIRMKRAKNTDTKTERTNDDDRVE